MGFNLGFKGLNVSQETKIFKKHMFIIGEDTKSSRKYVFSISQGTKW